MPTNAVRHQLKTVRAKKRLWLSIYMTNDEGEAKSLHKYHQQFRWVQKLGRCFQTWNMETWNSYNVGNKPPWLVPNSFKYLNKPKQFRQGHLSYPVVKCFLCGAFQLVLNLLGGGQPQQLSHLTGRHPCLHRCLQDNSSWHSSTHFTSYSVILTVRGDLRGWGVPRRGTQVWWCLCLGSRFFSTAP